MQLSDLTPLGRADKILEEELENFNQEKRQEYEEAFQNYRRVKISQLAVKVLLYASIVTSVTATLGFNIDFISRIASYIGTSVLVILYAGLSYITMVYREGFYVRREIMISSKA